MAKIPEVRIYYSALLRDTVSLPLEKLYGKKGGDNTSELWGYAENYRQEWAKYSERILTGLTDALDLEFYRGVIDAPCAPWVRATSDPLLLNFQFYPDQFVDLLTHELCHILLTDNTAYPFHSSERRFDMDKRWQGLFGEEHKGAALYHIPVFALLKYIWTDVLQEPARLERDIERLKDDKPYTAAWNYVQKHDYKQIIEQLKADYAAIKKELVT